jgi:hypothetical protein
MHNHNGYCSINLQAYIALGGSSKANSFGPLFLKILCYTNSHLSSSIEMLCANCLDIDLFAILKGDHKGIPLEKGHEVWITRSSDATAIWIWDSEPGCEFCEFLSATQSNLIPPNDSIQPRYLQLDCGRSWVRRLERDGTECEKVPLHVNIVFDTWDGWPAKHTCSEPENIVSFSISKDTEMPSFQPSPLRVDEIPTWLDLNSVKRQLQNCLHRHGSCDQQKEISDSRPTRLRVIDCSTRAVVMPSHDVSYVALSYRWGKGHTGSPDQQMDVLPTDVPTSIDDAIRVTQSLGFQYLWVDAYCVRQTDENDFRHQIRQMHLIYRSAEITIMAAGCMKAKSGLVGISIPRRSVQTKGRYDTLSLTTFYLWPWTSVYYYQGWIQRAWTFQEAYFSRRRLVFTEEQVLFDCNEGVVSEDLQSSQIHYRYRLEKWEPGEEVRLIYNLIESYTGRVLTHNADILNAFDGIVGHFEQQEPPVRSHWGIPLLFDASGYLNGLLIGLCWAHPIQNGQIYRRQGFPSWSWAGWSRHLLAQYRLRRMPCTELSVADGMAVQVEKQNGLAETWKTFEEASLACTQRQHYSQRIHLSAPSLEVRVHKEFDSMECHGGRIHGYRALIVRGEEYGYWWEEALLDSRFENLDLSPDTFRYQETRTCYAIYLFLADKMRRPHDDRHVRNTFAMLLVSKVGTNWERVGLWAPSFESKEDAQSFEQWLQSSQTYETRGFWIA